MNIKTLCIAFVSAAATLSAQPMIKNIVPETAASGFGQTITLQGFNLDLTNSPKVFFAPENGGPTLSCAFTLASASTTNEMYARLVNGCSIPEGKYGVFVEATNGASDKFPYEVVKTPARPIARALCVETFAGCQNAATTSTWWGGKIRITAYGIDTTNVVVELHRGNIMVPVTPSSVVVGAAGIQAVVTVPSSIGVGPTLVGVRAKVGSTTSTLSNLFKVQVEMP